MLVGVVFVGDVPAEVVGTAGVAAKVNLTVFPAVAIISATCAAVILATDWSLTASNWSPTWNSPVYNIYIYIFR